MRGILQRIQTLAERRLPALSTYLGHTQLSYTYWYLHQNPGLMTEAMARLQHRWEAPA